MYSALHDKQLSARLPGMLSIALPMCFQCRHDLQCITCQSRGIHKASEHCLFYFVGSFSLNLTAYFHHRTPDVHSVVPHQQADLIGTFLYFFVHCVPALVCEGSALD
ncbi:hypothetical protein OE88DRAFT_1655018 [Heliocybe sulcata]|uniref:Uncharacterized protein n=1 Tax=Heliocybe sulcata TaxID=5364 RepID=A0A5C3N963_9AGAM|nr:hypothetical protein OE88DRAFT_1655018 [Heliocybe sulcata]